MGQWENTKEDLPPNDSLLKEGFILKDSGQREEFRTGMVRDSRQGKGRFDLIPPTALRRIALIYEAGATKYSPRNWEKGSEYSRFIDSASRHINDYRAGLRDEDHLAQACFNLMAILHFNSTGRDGEFDDLPKYVEGWHPDLVRGK